MKNLMLVFATLCSISLMAQTQNIKKIASFVTSEKNEKSIWFSKKTEGENISFLLSAENRTSKDFAKCKWESAISKKQLKQLIKALESVDTGVSVESSIFHLTLKKNEIKVQINKTKCISGHKTFYFQKSCKRELSFIISTNLVNRLISTLKEEMAKDDFASNQ